MLLEQSGPLTVNNTATITTKRRSYRRIMALVQIVLKNPTPRSARYREERSFGETTSLRPLSTRFTDDSYPIIVFIALHRTKNIFEPTIEEKIAFSPFRSPTRPRVAARNLTGTTLPKAFRTKILSNPAALITARAQLRHRSDRFNIQCW